VGWAAVGATVGSGAEPQATSNKAIAITSDAIQIERIPLTFIGLLLFESSSICGQILPSPRETRQPAFFP
jgi:hypothetical protein